MNPFSDIDSDTAFILFLGFGLACFGVYQFVDEYLAPLFCPRPEERKNLKAIGRGFEVRTRD